MIIRNMCPSWHPFKGLWKSDLGRLLMATAIPRAGSPAFTFFQLHLALTLASRRLLQAELIPEVLQRLADDSQVYSKALDLASRRELFSNNSKNQQAYFPFCRIGTLMGHHPGGNLGLLGHCLDSQGIQRWFLSDPAG